MENITRIADLPENITMQLSNTMTSNNNNVGNFNQGSESINTNYVPINIHPNPYGISTQNPIMPLPQQTTGQQFQQNTTTIQQLDQTQIQKEMNNIPQVKLPSRDIPTNTINYINDEEIQANYIPKKKLTKDYIEEYETKHNNDLREHEDKKRKEDRLDKILNEIQNPLFITILFFVFQLPIINSVIFKKFSFLSIYNLDGNFNFYGLLLKSILFGSFYYLVQKITNFIVVV